MKIVSIFGLLSTLLLFADEKIEYLDENADRVYKNEKALPSKSIGFNADLGYTNYQIDVFSTELDRAIDYDVLELSLGASLSYGKWLYGVNFKSLVNELKSNVRVSESGNLLNDYAQIEREELSFYAIYPLNHEVNLNFVFRHAKLEASDEYLSFVDYHTNFTYRTDGLALALTFNRNFEKHHHLWLSTGIAYSQADVQIDEQVNGQFDDAYIDDKSKSMGLKIGAGYNYALSTNFTFKLSGDVYSFDFCDLEVRSRSQNSSLEKATLGEETYSLRAGFSYRF